MSPAVRSLLLALVVTLAAVGVGVVVTNGDDDPDEAAPTPTGPTTVPSTPLADYDTLTVAVTRGAFCDAVAPEAVERALGGPATDATAYGDGQPARVTDRVRDVAHEYGCTWTAGGVSARAWVFAPPVTPAQARALAKDARADDGCGPVPGAATYGRPAVSLLCETRRGTYVSYRGLFGDAWLSCSLGGSVPRADAADRTGRWCVAVAQAAATVTPADAIVPSESPSEGS